MDMMISKGQTQNLTSGQGHVVTYEGQIMYDSMCSDEASIARPFQGLYLLSLILCLSLI